MSIYFLYFLRVNLSAESMFLLLFAILTEAAGVPLCGSKVVKRIANAMLDVLQLHQVADAAVRGVGTHFENGGQRRERRVHAQPPKARSDRPLARRCMAV